MPVSFDDFVAPQYYTYGDAPWYTPEVVLAAGPRNVGDTGDGDYTALYGYAYVGAIVDGVFRLWQLHNANGLPYSLAGDSPIGGRLVRVLELPLPEGARHLALAFDQAAREVIAYEVDGQIYVRQWDAVAQQYTMRGPFPGVDPVLINDATVGYFPPDSDVLLFHLTQDRKTLIMRAQRELYNTPHTVHSFDYPVILDQAVALPYQIELLGSQVGALNTTGYVLRSEMYPAYLNDVIGQATLAPPSEGAYTPIVITQDFTTDLLGTATLNAPTTGSYDSITIVQDLGTDVLGQVQLSAPSMGAYVSVVIVVDLGTDTLGTTSLTAPATGSYALAVIVVNTTTQSGYTSPDVLGTATLSAPTTGAYELA